MTALARLFSGLAWASCWPVSLQAAKQGDPTPFLVGAACALLPETLDRWGGQFLTRDDIHIVPDPADPHPAPVADALALAVDRCHRAKHRLRVGLYTASGPAYVIRFDNQDRVIAVSCGTTKALAVIPTIVTTDGPFTVETGSTAIRIEMRATAGKRVAITIGPGGWPGSHTLAAAGVMGLAIGILWGAATGAIAAGAYALHIVMDQMSYSGRPWLAPFSRRGTCGFQWILPGRIPFLHLAVLWIALLVLGWTLTRSAFPAEPPPSLLQWLLFAGGMPLAGLWLLTSRHEYGT